MKCKICGKKSRYILGYEKARFGIIEWNDCFYVGHNRVKKEDLRYVLEKLPADNKENLPVFLIKCGGRTSNPNKYKNNN